ncbi:MAG TPA: hypothetical protein VIJ55_03735 [Acetobacteraceae bacterium]
MIDVTHVTVDELATGLPAPTGAQCLGALAAAGITHHQALGLLHGLAGRFAGTVDDAIGASFIMARAVFEYRPDLDLPHALAAGEALARLAHVMSASTSNPGLYGDAGRVLQ